MNACRTALESNEAGVAEKPPASADLDEGWKPSFSPPEIPTKFNKLHLREIPYNKQQVAPKYSSSHA